MKPEILNVHDGRILEIHNGTVTIVRLIKNALGEEPRLATFNYAWLNQGDKLQPHSHPDGVEHYLFLEGVGEMMITDEWFGVKPGDFLSIPAGALHTLKNDAKSKLIFLTMRTIANK